MVAAVAGHIRVDHSGRCVVVSLSGEIDAYVRPMLEGRLSELPEPDQRVVLDLGAVEFMDSGGLGLIAAIHQRLSRDERPICTVIRPQQRHLRKTFEISGMSRVVAIYDSRDDAVEACCQQRDAAQAARA
jgi:anti-anti-sigma factor